MKNLHRAEFWGQFFAKGRKGEEASRAGVWVPLRRCQLLALNPSSSRTELPSVGAGSGLGWTPAGATCPRRPLPCPLAQARAAQDKGSGGSCPDRRAGATAATRSARCLRHPAGEARRPPLSAPPRRAGSAGSARHRAAGAGHCTPGGAARPSRGQNRRARLESSRGRRCHRDGDCCGGSGAFC